MSGSLETLQWLRAQAGGYLEQPLDRSCISPSYVLL